MLERALSAAAERYEVSALPLSVQWQEKRQTGRCRCGIIRSGCFSLPRGPDLPVCLRARAGGV